jgi:hypothetical protein
VPSIKKVTIQATSFMIIGLTYIVPNYHALYAMLLIKLSNQLTRASAEFLENYQWALF